jgi:hypothetical protein
MICRTGVFSGWRFFEDRLPAGFREDDRLEGARDDVRREGEVFVAIEGEV